MLRKFDLTVFVITCGENPNFNDCMNALKSNEKFQFNIEVIKNIAPMNNAFQEMINRCKSKYFIQIDEDMIIQSDCIEILYNEIGKSSDNTAFICAKLFDPHAEINLVGVKCYKYEILKKYPYTDSISCEVDQLKRMELDGYKYVLLDKVLGTHSPKWTNSLIFDRYFRLMEKYKHFGYEWIPGLVNKFIGRLDNENDIYALLGMYTSIIGSHKQVNEKDYRIINPSLKKFEIYRENVNRATLYMTYKCNYNCFFCCREHQSIEVAPDMDIFHTDLLLKRFPNIKGVCICGFGEPFISRNLPFVVERLKTNNVYVGIISNGSLINKNLGNLLDRGKPDYISISLNSGDEKEHQKITGTKTYKTVLEGIKSCKENHITTYISAVIDRKKINNIRFFKKLFEISKKFKLDGIHLHNILPHFDKSLNGDFKDLVLRKEDEKLIQNIKKLDKDGLIKVFPKLINFNNIRYGCSFPYDHISINGSGNVTLCNSVYPCDSKYGNIKRPDIWFSKNLMDFRNKMENGKIEACKHCFRSYEKE
jgi:MoaA/NifB/PqqE/SkfB family radical SAM enzyme